MAGTHNEISGTVEGTVIQARDVIMANTTAFAGEPVWLVPAPDRQLVDRAEIDDVVRRLAAGAGLVGVVGPGGFGKTTLVAQACARVRDRFPGGVLWVALGEQMPDPVLADKINDLSEVVSGHRPGLTDPTLAGHHLGRLLAARPPTLLVVDDVWSASRLTAFPAVPRLVTTRSRGVLPARADVVPVTSMSARESKALLTIGVGGLTSTARLERLTGRWPILLSLVNSAIRHTVADGNSPEAAAELVADQLLLDGPDSLDLGSADLRDRAVRATIEASVRRLDQADRDRFRQLGIFAEDIDIPVAVAGLLWDLNPTATRRLCRQLGDASLVTWAGDAMRLHDVLRTYLRQALGDERITALNATMSERLRAEATDWAAARPYTRRHLAGHAAAAGLLDLLLTDAGFLLAADQPELLAVLGTATAPQARAAAGVYQRVAHHLRDRPADEWPAYLELAAHRAGDPNLAIAAGALATRAPWRCPSAVWAPERPHTVLTRHSSPVTNLAIARLPHGQVWVFSSDAEGVVRITDVVGSKAVERPWLESIQDCARLACVPLPNGEVVLVVCRSRGIVVARNLVTGETTTWQEAIDLADRSDPTEESPDPFDDTSLTDPWDAEPLDDPGWPDPFPPTEPHDLDWVEEAEDPWDSRSAQTNTDDLEYYLWRGGKAIVQTETPHGPVVSIVFGQFRDYVVLSWDVGTHRPVGPPLARRAPSYRRYALDVESRPDGTLAVTVADGTKVVAQWNEVWDARTGRRLPANPIEPDVVHDESVPLDTVLTTVELPRAHAVLPDGREVRAYRDDGTIRLWDPSAPDKLGPQVNAHTGAVAALASTRLDNDRVVVISGGGDDGDVRLWDLSELTADPADATHIRPVRKLVTAGRFLVSEHSEPDRYSSTLWLWENGKRIGTLNDFYGRMVGAANDPVLLFTTLFGADVDVLDLTTGEVIAQWSTEGVTALAAVALHDKRRIAVVATRAPAVQAFDLDTHAPLWTVHGYARVKALGATEGHNGRTVVLCGDDECEIHTFDAATGEEIRPPLGAPWTHVDTYSPTFLAGWPNGNGLFVTAGPWPLVWDLVSGRPITWRTEGTTTHHAPVCWSAPDGSRFIVTTHKSHVRCWRLEPIPPADRSTLTAPTEAVPPLEPPWDGPLAVPFWDFPPIPSDPSLDDPWPAGLDSVTPSARLVLAWEVDLDLPVTALAGEADGSVVVGTRRGIVRLRAVT